MVCKEEVFSWFQSLKGSKRIETMCMIMNMCFPLELRFYGTCLEDLGRKDFYVFKEEETKANDLTEILKIKNIHESHMRSKVIVVLSLLNSSNMIGAQELFKVLSEEIKIETLSSFGIFSDPKQVDQYLLVLALAQHHPAFTFEQQTFLSHLTVAIENYINELASSLQARNLYQEPYLSSSYFTDIPPPYSISEKDMYSNHQHSYRYIPLQARPLEHQYSPGQITNLKVKPPHRKSCIRIRVVWGSSKITDAFKYPHDLLTFHHKLVQMFPNEAKGGQDKYIPPLPPILASWNKQNNLSDAVILAVTEYIQQLNTRLPGYILDSDYMKTFFMPSFPNRATLGRNNRSNEGHNEMPPRNARLRSLTIYNSQMSDNPRHRVDNKQKIQGPPALRKPPENGSTTCPQPSPVNSPLESPLSSPYTSPVNSGTNSRAPSPWSIATGLTNTTGSHMDLTSEKVHIKENHEVWDGQKNVKSPELPLPPVAELESLVIAKDPCMKANESKNPPNGILGYYLPKSNIILKSPPPVQSNSNDSSPVCSEYSSPPQSPSPGEACNHSSSLSSGNEEGVEKRPFTKPSKELCKVEESEPIAPSEMTMKVAEDESSGIGKGSLNRNSVSVIPFPVPYNTIITQMPPPQNMKPTYLPVPCRTNCGPQHLNPGQIVFDNQFTRVPLPSALTFLPGPPRSHHSAAPDRILPTTGLPLSTVTPFPVTSGCATVPSASCSIASQRNSSVTIVTNSGPRHSNNKTTLPEVSGKSSETPYATGYILNSNPPMTAVSCSCFTTNSARPSSSPSPSGATPSVVPVTMSYLGMPYLFHHSIPFLPAQTSANGFLPQTAMGTAAQTFSYALPNGLTALPPELIYPNQGFTLQSPSTQGNPGSLPTPVSQCYAPFSPPAQTAAVPIKLITCFNCGKGGHRGSECKEQTMDDLNKQGKFQLNYNPLPKMPDSNE